MFHIERWGIPLIEIRGEEYSLRKIWFQYEIREKANIILDFWNTCELTKKKRAGPAGKWVVRLATAWRGTHRVPGHAWTFRRETASRGNENARGEIRDDSEM